MLENLNKKKQNKKESEREKLQKTGVRNFHYTSLVL